MTDSVSPCTMVIDLSGMSARDLRRLEEAAFYSTRNTRMRRGYQRLRTCGATAEEARYRVSRVWDLSEERVRDICDR
ncbi:MAG: hypothetical protein Rubg2KO_15460 [Rubricoccaceae bacterium]